MHAGREFGALNDTDADISILYSKKNRMAKARWNLIFVIIYGLLISYIIAISILFEGTYKDPCVNNLVLFLQVYMAIAAMQLLRAIITVAMFLYSKDPGTATMKMEFFFGYWVALIEIAWTCFGNWVIYSDKLEKECEIS